MITQDGCMQRRTKKQRRKKETEKKKVKGQKESKLVKETERRKGKKDFDPVIQDEFMYRHIKGQK